MTAKALIIYRVNRCEPSNIGVINKLIGQVSGLEAQDYKVDYVLHDNRHVYLNNEPIASRKTKLGTVYFNINFYNYLSIIDSFSYDLVIIRYGLSTPSLLKFLKILRSKGNSQLVLLDMPTYPYKFEWSGTYGWLALFMDGLYRNQLRKYVDGIMHSGREQEIFHIPIIQFTNGIQLNRTSIRKINHDQSFTFLAVGKWKRWHGLDRLIKGISHHVQLGNDAVLVRLVGEGPELRGLRKLVEKLDLSQFVKFEGTVVGKALDDLFDKADMGIGTLGLHRKNVEIDSSLKHREYVSRGLPFVMSSRDSDNMDQLPFVLKVREDDSDLVIDELINFINRLNLEQTAKDMRRYAEDHLSWKVKMKDLMRSAKVLK